MKANMAKEIEIACTDSRERKTPVVCHINPSSWTSSSTILLHDAVVRDALDAATCHAGTHIALEAITVASQILSSLLVQRIASIGLEEQELQTHNNSIQVQHRLPVLAQDVQAHVSLEVDVGVVDLLRALDLRRLVWEVLADVEGKVEGAVLVHALVGCDGQAEVQDVVGVWEGRCHGAAERQFRKIYIVCQYVQYICKSCLLALLHTQLCCRDLLLLCATRRGGLVLLLLLFLSRLVSIISQEASSHDAYHRPDLQHLEFVFGGD